MYGTIVPSVALTSGNSGTPELFERLSSLMSKGVGSMSKYIAGLSTNLPHPLKLDWGHVILFSTRAKWLQRARRLKHWDDRPCSEDWQQGL